LADSARVATARQPLIDQDSCRGNARRARKSFEQALRLDPQNASAHNGLGNVLFFEGQFDAAIKEIDTALELTGGNYSEAEHDRRLVEAVKKS
jgi:lipoprotein NlpI